MFSQEEQNNDVLDISQVLSLDIDDLLKLNVQLSTGSYLEYDQKNSPLSMTIITSEQIELSGARHMSEVLEIYVPGFQYMVNKWNGIIWGMRGVSSDRNTKFIYLINGHKMNHESRDGAMSELDLGLLSDVDRIEVLRGPGGLVYGSGAIAGIINVVTKKVANPKESVTLRSNLHNWNMNSGGGGIEGLYQNQITKDLSLTLSLGYRKSSGVGEEEGRIWGYPSFPYPYQVWNEDVEIPESVPTAGSPWSTPGNFRGNIDIDYKNLNFFMRATHQVTNGSSWFPLDPWPETAGGLDSTAESKFIDGEYRSWDSFYGLIEPWQTHRRQYQIDNIMGVLSHHHDVGKNTLKTGIGFDHATNRIQRQDLKSSYGTSYDERNTFIEETFGERRFNADVQYILKGFEKLELATGYQFRVFDIGNDIEGLNSQQEKSSHPIVSDVTYFNHAFFAEGQYQLSKKLTTHLGARYDLHTRTIQHGGILSPKLALQYELHKNHIINLIYQSSSNNGSADNYEFNRNSIDDNGNPITGTDYHYENPQLKPDQATDILPPVTEELLHQLKPERAHSIEFSSFHQFKKKLIVSQSVSLNRVQDFFVWNQALFRMLNGGEYDFINTDLDIRYADKRCQFGINHTFQQLVNMDLDKQVSITTTPKFDGYDSTMNSMGIVTYFPTASTDSVITDTLNYISDGISYDGNHFLNLASNITKLFFEVKVHDKITFHSDLRIFWELKGRQELHDDYPQFNYLDIDSKPMLKWNASVHIKASDSFSVSLLVYDILGSNNTPINTLRWQKRGTEDQNALYGLDYRSFAINLQYDF